jgi:hypothetical protein
MTWQVEEKADCAAGDPYDLHVDFIEEATCCYIMVLCVAIFFSKPVTSRHYQVKIR